MRGVGTGADRTTLNHHGPVMFNSALIFDDFFVDLLVEPVRPPDNGSTEISDASAWNDSEAWSDTSMWSA